MKKLADSSEFQTWKTAAEAAIASHIEKNPFGPFPSEGQRIRAILRDGQVIDGSVERVWLDLDIVRIDVKPPWTMNSFRITPEEGDSWLARRG